MNARHASTAAGLLALLFAQPLLLPAEQVTVRHREGSIHGFLSLRSLDGKLIGSGDLVQTIKGDRVVTHLSYHFKDGSVDDDTAIFTQRGQFRLISDHHVQKGPMFDKPMDVLVDAASGQVTVKYEEKGEQKVENQHMDLPPDLVNGMILDVMKNIEPSVAETKMSYLAATPKPRIVTFAIKPEGDDSFSFAGISRPAVRFVIHIEIGGISGAIAPLVGKEPADSRVWISTGDGPAFVKSEVPLFVGGPAVRTELAGPTWRTESGKGAEAAK